MRRRDRQEEQSDEVPEQVSTGRQNPIPEEVDPTAGSTGGSVADGRVEQLVAVIGEIRHEMRTLIELLAELSHPKSGCVTGQRQTYTYASEALTY